MSEQAQQDAVTKADAPPPVEPPAAETTDEEMAKMEKLPKAIKEAMAKTLTEAIERMVSVARAVKDAEESDDGAVSQKMTDEMHAIGGLLGGMMERYPSPTAKVEKATDLLLPMKIREAASRLYSACYDEKCDEAALKQRVADIAAALMEATGGKQMAAPPDGEGDEMDDKKPDECAKGDDKVTETVPAVAAAAEDQVAKSAEPATPDPLQVLTAQVSELTKAVAAITKAAEPPAAPAAPVDMVEIGKKLDQLETENAELKTKLAKAEEDPPARASAQETRKNDDGAGIRVFPEFYGDPIHDPSGPQT